MPRIRSIILEQVRAGPVEGVGMEAIRSVIGCSYSTAYRAVEDLEVHGVVEKRKEAGAREHRVVLSPWMAREWKKGWRGI